jgi:ubiquinone/menaquinone biosynthesis C-methylase UbiE
MAEMQIRFDDGAGYERAMGAWSRLVGHRFIDWLAAPPELKWADIGCGNGGFTELIVERCAPAEVVGVDPSEAQLAFARARPSAGVAEFHEGDAMALPFDADRFDMAAMALVIFFVPDPAGALAETVRVVVPGGTVAAYAWDAAETDWPLGPFHAEMRALGVTMPLPPSVEAGRMQELRRLWAAAGLERVETTQIRVQRTFADFDACWTAMTGTTIGRVVAGMAAADVDGLKARMRARFSADDKGRVTYGARANAIKGVVPD